MNPEENDALWKLLGKADRKPEISPTFSQDVTRLARQYGKPKDGFWQKLTSALNPSRDDGSTQWLYPTAALGALAAVAIAAAVLLNGNDNPGRDPEIVEKDPPAIPEAVAPNDPVLEVFEEEMEQIDQFDALLSVTDVDDLADEEIAMLLF